MSEVEFPSGAVRCAAVHLTGEGDGFRDEQGLRPCVVMAHGFAGTIDSGLLPFAERYVAAGLDALVFDYRHFGASDGQPRQLLSIARQHEDYAAAIAFARTLAGVDPDRIVLWGSSFSGGHVVPVAVADGRVAAVISQVPGMDGLATIAKLVRYAGPAQLLRSTITGLKDQISAARGGAPVTIAAVGPPGSLAAMTTPDAEPGYKAITGPSWRNEVCARVVLGLGLYRPGRMAGALPCPILIQIADRDAVVPVKAAQDAAWLATGRAEVRTYPIGHFDIYTGPPFEQATGDQIHFLRRHLGRARQPAAILDGAERTPLG
jgi:fermentation-respiration switch protein FrsA (DUF1100 family)